MVAGRRASLSELIKSLLITSFWLDLRLWFRLGHRMSFKSVAEVSCKCTVTKPSHNCANKRHLRHIRQRQALMKKTFADVQFLRPERVMRQAQTTGTGLFSSQHKTCLSGRVQQTTVQVAPAFAQTESETYFLYNMELVLFSPQKQSDGFPLWVSPVKFSNGQFLGHNW